MRGREGGEGGREEAKMGESEGGRERWKRGRNGGRERGRMEEDVDVFQTTPSSYLSRARQRRDDMTECGHSGWVGVCPRISETRSGKQRWR